MLCASFLHSRIHKHYQSSRLSLHDSAVYVQPRTRALAHSLDRFEQGSSCKSVTYTWKKQQVST